MESNNSFRKTLIPFIAGVLIVGLAFYFTKKNSSENLTAEKAGFSPRLHDTSVALQPEAEPTDQPATTEPTALAAEQVKWQELQQIIQSKNDNDPRLDQDFKKMNSELHALLRDKYAEVPMEDRNQRGLIAFLIARDLKNNDDLEFLKKIYEENPCLSLEDCKAKSQDDPHLAGIDQASMNYPQLVSLYQLEKQMKENGALFSDPKIKETARALLDQAAQFPVQGVKERAAKIKNQYPL